MHDRALGNQLHALLVTTCIFVLSGVPLAEADIPPLLPKNRDAALFAPSLWEAIDHQEGTEDEGKESGNKEFETVCTDHDYALPDAQKHVQRSEPPGTGTPSVRIEHLKDELQAERGLFWINCHGGDGWLYIEPYEYGTTKAEQTLQYYLNSGYQSANLTVIEFGPGETSYPADWICVNTGFWDRWAKFDRSLVFIAACHSYSEFTDHAVSKGAWNAWGYWHESFTD